MALVFTLSLNPFPPFARRKPYGRNQLLCSGLFFGNLERSFRTAESSPFPEGETSWGTAPGSWQATFSSQNRMQLRPEGTYQPSPKRPQLRFVLSPARIRRLTNRTSIARGSRRRNVGSGLIGAITLPRGFAKPCSGPNPPQVPQTPSSCHFGRYLLARPGQQRTEEGAEVRHRLKKSQARKGWEVVRDQVWVCLDMGGSFVF